MSSYRVGVVGASGAVGTELIRLLETSPFPVQQLRCFASHRSQGKTVSFRQETIPIETLSSNNFSAIDLLFFCAGKKVSLQYIPSARLSSAIIIDCSSAFRMQKNIPLIIPEINPHACVSHEGLIASPNCAATLLLMALFPLHRIAKLKRIVVATYQAISGAGKQAMQDLQQATLSYLQGTSFTSSYLPHLQGFNLFLHDSPVQDNGYNEEENKIIEETRKILEDDTIAIAPSCTRVPILRSHSEAINAQFHHPISPKQAYHALQTFPGIRILEDPKRSRFPMPTDATGQHDVLCGRIRQDLSQENTLDLWVVGDQLLKGAALNALQIAYLLIKKNNIDPL